MSFRRYDLYSKSVEGIEVKTLGGGIITILSFAIVAFLFFSEFLLFISVDVVNRMHVDITPHTAALSVDIDISFLHAACEEVAMDVSDAKGDTGILISNNVRTKSETNGGCRFYGSFDIQKVAGDITFLHKGAPNLFNLGDFLNLNTSHVVHYLNFGPKIPNMITPLLEAHKTVTQNVAVYKYFIKIVPTKYVYLFGSSTNTYQYSVTEHVRKPDESGQITFPGVIFGYEISPIKVEYIETKPSIFQFLTNTCAIIGGVVAVASLIDRIVYRVTKKQD